MPDGEKWCRRCETVKPAEAFAANIRRPDGLQGSCRTCQAAAYRARQEAAGKLVRPPDIPDDHKFCRTCRTVKPRSAFGIRRAAPDGLMSACRACRVLLGRRDYLLRSYGLSEEEVADLYAAQQGLCAICRTAEAVHVDHDHATGAVRGMLCFSCNAALGQLRDDPALLRRAARYLERAAHVSARDEAAWAAVLWPAHPTTPSRLEALFAARLAEYR